MPILQIGNWTAKYCPDCGYQDWMGHSPTCRMEQVLEDMSFDVPLRERLLAAQVRHLRSEVEYVNATLAAVRSVIHSNECSDECGWFAFWEGPAETFDERFANRVIGCLTEGEAIVAFLETERAAKAVADGQLGQRTLEVITLKARCENLAKQLQAFQPSPGL